jgi:prepilin-type N-terminal cleavage/methylation domain-containing protein
MLFLKLDMDNSFICVVQRKYQRISASKAFTLVEILIAIAILNMGVVLFFNAFTTAMRGILGGQRRVLAVNYGQQLMEKYVMPKKFNDLSVATVYVNNATTDNFKLQYQVNYANALNLDQTVSGVTDYKRVLVTVTDNRGVVPAVNIIMLKTDYEGLE